MSVQVYSLGQVEEERKAFFGGCKKRGQIVRLPLRAWCSIINMWIDSTTCQKYRILLSARQRSNNYLEFSKENVLRKIMLSHWPCFTGKFFMIWFNKILKLIFQRQPSCSRNIFIEEHSLFSQLSWKVSYTLRATIL